MVFDYTPQYKSLIDLIDHGEKSSKFSPIVKFEAEHSKLFVVEKNICSAIINTKTLPSLFAPFSEMIIVPEHLFFNNCKINAIQLLITIYDPVEKMQWRHIIGTPEINYQMDSNSKEFITARYALTDEKGQTHLRTINYPDDVVSLLNVDTSLKYNTFRFDSEVQNFISGFINFLNNPEVSFSEHKNNHNNEKRIKKGKISLPSKTIIQVSGKLKVYLDNYEKESNHKNFSYRFWVRGHFRHLYSDKWKNKVGQTIWIVPYIKGKGILVNKSYEVKA